MTSHTIRRGKVHVEDGEWQQMLALCKYPTLPKSEVYKLVETAQRGDLAKRTLLVLHAAMISQFARAELRSNKPEHYRQLVRAASAGITKGILTFPLENRQLRLAAFAKPLMAEMLDLDLPAQRRDMDFDNVLRSVEELQLDTQSGPKYEMIEASLETARLKHRRPTIAKERELIALAKEGHHAEEKLTRHNSRLILRIAKTYYFPGTSDDIGTIFSIGAMGFVRSILLFDTSRNLALSTYATPWIRSQISKQSISPGRPIHYAHNVRRLLKKMRRCEEVTLTQFNRLPSISELMEATGASEKRLLESRFFAKEDCVSLDTYIDAESSGGATGRRKRIDMIQDTNAESATDTILHNELIAIIKELMKDGTLSDREADIIQSRFLLRKESLEEIGNRYKVTRGWVRDIEKLALRKLKRSLCERGFTSF